VGITVVLSVFAAAALGLLMMEFMMPKVKAGKLKHTES
jgi:hypothetical protein